MNEIRVGGSSFVEEVRRLGRRRHQNQSGSDQENVFRASKPEAAKVLAGEAVGVGDVRPGHCPDRGLGLVAPAAAQHQHEVFITQPVTTTDLLSLSSPGYYSYYSILPDDALADEFFFQSFEILERFLVYWKTYNLMI